MGNRPPLPLPISIVDFIPIFVVVIDISEEAVDDMGARLALSRMLKNVAKHRSEATMRDFEVADGKRFRVHVRLEVGDVSCLVHHVRNLHDAVV